MGTHKSNTNLIKKYLDVKLIKILALFCLITVIVVFFQISYFKIQKEETYDLLDNFIKHFLVDWVIICLFMSIVSMITRAFFLKNIRSIYIILFHLIVSLCFGWVYSFIHSSILLVLGKIDYSAFLYYTSFNMTIAYLSRTFLLYLGMTGIIYTYYYSSRLKTAELQRALLAEQLTQTRMSVLKSQLQPHFLFNTLHSISSLIETNTKQAQNTLNDLSDLLREVIILREDHFNSLAQELYILQKYIDIILIRYSDHLTITTHIGPNIEDTPVPLMMMQPIVENAIKHGFTGNTNALQIEISIIEKDEQLLFEIKNNGTPITSTLDELASKGSGLHNIISRLEALYQNNYSFEIVNLEQWVVVSIKILRYQNDVLQD